jgi:tetratricopeptide (TPR) repeat protein
MLSSKRFFCYSIFTAFSFLITLFAFPLLSQETNPKNQSDATKSFSPTLQVVEQNISLPLRDFNAIKETITSYNLIPNRKLSISLTFIGYDYLNVKDWALAFEAFQTAQFADRTYFPAYLGEAESLIKKNMFNIFYPAPARVLVGLYWGFKDFWQLSFFYGEILLVCLAVLLLSFTVFIVVLFLKKEVLLRHDVKEILKASSETLIPMSVIWIIILICFFVGGLAWLILIVGIALFAYLNRNEKILFISFLLLCSLSTTMLLGASIFITSFDSHFVRVAVDYMNGSIIKGHIIELTRYVQKNPEDFTAKYLLALMKTKIGIYNLDAKMLYGALDDFNAMIKDKPDQAKLYVNTGNIYFSLSNYTKAISDYQKAIDLAPGNYAAHFNLSLAFRKTFKFDEANQELKKALSLNKDKVEYYSTLKIPNMNDGIRLIPEEISFEQLWDKVMTTKREKVWGFVENLWADLVKGIKFEFIPIFFPIIIITSFITHFIRKKFEVPQSCLKCGITFCRKCLTGKERKDLCLQCTQLESKASSISPELRLAKLAQIKNHERYELYKIKLLSFVLPGCGHLYAGQSYKGIVYLVLWLFLSSIIIMGLDILSFPWNINMSNITWILYIPFIALAISLYFYVNFLSINKIELKKH